MRAWANKIGAAGDLGSERSENVENVRTTERTLTIVDPLERRLRRQEDLARVVDTNGRSAPLRPQRQIELGELA